MRFPALTGLAAAVLAVCAAGAQAGTPRLADDPYPSTYQPVASAPVLIRNATVLTGDGPGRAHADHRRTRIQDLFASFHRDTTGLALEPAAQAALERIGTLSA